MGYEVDFLPVGDGEKSGDALLLRFGNLLGPRAEQTVVLIDGGFKKTAPTVVKHIETYYQTDLLDLVVSTHPDSDHINGLLPILEEFKVTELWIHRPSVHRTEIERALRSLDDHEYLEAVRACLDTGEELEDLALQNGVTIREPFTGITHSSGLFSVLGPTEEYYSELFREEPEDEGENLLRTLAGAFVEYLSRAAESLDIETLTDKGETTPLNNSSAITMLEYDNQRLIFTADAGMPALDRAADELEGRGCRPDQLAFIQVPHHGSRRNVGPSILNRLLGAKRTSDESVRTAFVSSAPDGEPKHPAKKVANAFRRRGSPVHATKGVAKWHHKDAPSRGWSKSEPLPFYDEVDD